MLGKFRRKNSNAIREPSQGKNDSVCKIRISGSYGREIDSFGSEHPCAGHRDTEPQRTAAFLFKRQLRLLQLIKIVVVLCGSVSLWHALGYLDPLESVSLQIPRGMKHGFTIVETTITLAIIGLLSAIALPRASGFLDAIRVRGAVTEIEALFSTARHVAIARAAQTSLEIDPARGAIIVRTGPDTLEKRELRESEGVTLLATRTVVTYSPTGLGYGAVNLTLIVARNLAADTIYVSRLGRVRH